MFVVTAIVAPGFVFCDTGLKVARETASFLCLQRLLPILIGLLTAAAAVVVLSSGNFFTMVNRYGNTICHLGNIVYFLQPS